MSDVLHEIQLAAQAAAQAVSIEMRDKLDELRREISDDIKEIKAECTAELRACQEHQAELKKTDEQRRRWSIGQILHVILTLSALVAAMWKR